MKSVQSHKRNESTESFRPKWVASKFYLEKLDIVDDLFAKG